MDLDLMRPHERYITLCAKCGREGLKKHMTTLLVKDKCGTVRTLCHLCPNCYARMLDELEVSAPD